MQNLSKRLKAVASLVKKGSSVADVGTDHGYIPVYLIENDIVSSAIAMDINVRREKATGSMFCFYFLASRTMKIIPNIRL